MKAAQSLDTSVSVRGDIVQVQLDRSASSVPTDVLLHRLQECPPLPPYAAVLTFVLEPKWGKKAIKNRRS